MTSQSESGPDLFESFAMTDVGRVRSSNEDTLLFKPEAGIFGVCDGMGGHAAGEVASGIAAEVVVQALVERFPEEEALREAVRQANRAILDDQSGHPEKLGMATTLTVFWLSMKPPLGAWAGHIGDSRLYRFRDGGLQRLTDDHTPVYRLYREGRLTFEEMENHPQRNLLERALGIETEPTADVFPVEVREEDLFLACSDGLTGMLTEEQIAALLAQSRPVDDIVRDLIRQANEEGGFDNVTVVLVRVSGDFSRG